MSETLKVQKFGDSLGIALPEDVDLEEGDEVSVTRTSAGIQIVIPDPEFAEVMEDAREFMRTHENAFRELAQ
jgi:antitoxin component of MazEF toxin-antitoxin module